MLFWLADNPPRIDQPTSADLTRAQRGTGDLVPSVIFCCFRRAWLGESRRLIKYRISRQPGPHKGRRVSASKQIAPLCQR